MYLNSYKTLTSQVLLNCLLKQQGQQKNRFANRDPLRRSCVAQPSAGMVRVGPTNVRQNATFGWLGVAFSHEMRVEREKLREHCDFETSDAPFSHGKNLCKFAIFKRPTVCKSASV